MKSDYSLDELKNFKIDPHVWLQTLLAIAGDREKKEEVIQIIAEKTGFPPDKVQVIMTAAIGALVEETRSN